MTDDDERVKHINSDKLLVVADVILHDLARRTHNIRLFDRHLLHVIAQFCKFNPQVHDIRLCIQLRDALAMRYYWDRCGPEHENGENGYVCILHKVWLHGDLEGIQILVGLDEIYLRHAMYYACQYGHDNIVRYLVDHGAKIGEDKHEAICLAARYGRLKVVEYLSVCGADIRARDDFPVRRAAEYGHLAVVQFLLSCGADIHAMNDHAFRCAAERGHLRVLEFILKQYWVRKVILDAALCRAVAHGHSHIVKLLVRYGAVIS